MMDSSRSTELVLGHSLTFVCHWLCQCDVKVCFRLEKATGRASDTPPELLTVTKH